MTPSGSGSSSNAARWSRSVAVTPLTGRTLHPEDIVVVGRKRPYQANHNGIWEGEAYEVKDVVKGPTGAVGGRPRSAACHGSQYLSRAVRSRDPLTRGSDPPNDVLDQARKAVVPLGVLAPRDLAIERRTSNPATLRTFGWFKVFTSDEPPDGQHRQAKRLSSIRLALPVFCRSLRWRVRPAPRDPRIPALLCVDQRAPPRLTFATNGVAQVHHQALRIRPDRSRSVVRPLSAPGPVGRTRRRSGPSPDPDGWLRSGWRRG